MSDDILFLDTETRSRLDLKKAGAFVYAKHPSTQVFALAFAIGFDDPVDLIREPRSRADIKRIAQHVEAGGMVAMHNAGFDAKILEHVLGLPIPLSQIIDTAACARSANLPGALEHLAAFFGYEKDMTGNRIMLKLSKPRRPSKTNPDPFWTRETKPEDFAKADAYCVQDTDIMRRCFSKLPVMTKRERAVFETTWRMNQRGVPIDREAARIMRRFVTEEKERMSEDIRCKYGFSLGQVAKITEFLGTTKADKAALRDYLKAPETPEGAEVAKARQTFAKASTAKLDAALAHTEVDGYDRDAIVYGGAERTLRFSSHGMQWQNVPRGMGKAQETAFGVLLKNDLDLFRMCYPDVIAAISGMLRGLMYAPGVGFDVVDYSQIEARLVAWIAGQKDMLQAFREGRDVYREMAAKIYHIALENVTDAQRFMGKQAVLGAGYGLSGRGFRYMLDQTYDVQIDLIEADHVVDVYRTANRMVRKLWKKLEALVLHALSNPGNTYGYRKIKAHAVDRQNFHLILPSGRRLRYYRVRFEEWGNWFTASYFGRLPSGAGYGRIKLYGGAMTGHVTQSTAREMVAEAMVRLDHAGFPLLLTVHDENVCLHDGRSEEMQALMSRRPDWLDDDFPFAQDHFHTPERYRK
jgi:DNA polymerase